MKWLFAVLIVVLLGLASPAYAFTPPTQDNTDNATDIVLWYGDTANVSITTANITLNPATITISGLDTALIDANQLIVDVIADSITNITALIMMLVVMLGLAFLAYLREDKPLFLIAGLAFIVYGFSFFATSFYFSILMVLAGIFFFIRAFSKRGIV